MLDVVLASSAWIVLLLNVYKQDFTSGVHEYKPET